MEKQKIAVIGASFGDEGKGRIVHDFSVNFDWVIRVSGSNNCGHTIYRDGKKYVHRFIPSMDFRIATLKGFLGSGMVINLKALYEELAGFEQDYPGISKRIYVDPDAFLIEQKHLDADGDNVKRLGSTNKGVGPAYASKMSRNGRKISDVLNDKDDYIDKLLQLGVNFKYVLELKEEFLNSSIIFEGSQGALLDLEHGMYPYVSCGNATVSGIYSSGFAFIKIDKVYGVAKVYTTKVGEGPFPTEIFGDVAAEIAKKGKEFGSVTGRPRRIGWLDLPALKYACDKSGITNLIFTKFDILDGMSNLLVATSYDKPIFSAKDFFTSKPIYENFLGWENKEDTFSISNFINFIENKMNLNVDFISVGVDPDDLINISDDAYYSLEEQNLFNL